MDTFGDPTFSRHVAVSKVLGLATMRLADSLILPLNVTGESLPFSSTLVVARTNNYHLI
jgi:N-acetylated-alpha-linked acidic dipeptidase